MQTRLGIEISSLSDLGCQREENEDYCSDWEPADDRELDRKGHLAVVADGMGGHEGGQEASRIAVETIRKHYADVDSADPLSLLIGGFEQANTRIQQYAREHPALLGMGTTLTAVAIVGSHLFYAHIGDSRLYLVRDSMMERLTHDHSYVGRLVENGVISSTEAETHPQRHILTAALGTAPDILPDVPMQPLQLQSGDVLVLCTDGLWGLVPEAEILQAVSVNSPEKACRSLVAQARSRGGPDNITLQVIRIS
jgi:protein phosphatase